jgi:hypothetical protein
MRALPMSSPNDENVRVMAWSSPTRSGAFTSTTVWVSDKRLSTVIRGGPATSPRGGRMARRASSRSSTVCSLRSTERSESSVRAHRAFSVTASPNGSLTWNVSIAMPSARVWIWADRMLIPDAASVPAISENSPDTSLVTMTSSEEPRSGWWNSSVAAPSSSSRSTRRRCAAMRWGEVLRR